jgi:hypothetical protein
MTTLGLGNAAKDLGLLSIDPPGDQLVDRGSFNLAPPGFQQTPLDLACRRWLDGGLLQIFQQFLLRFVLLLEQVADRLVRLADAIHGHL